MQGRVDLTIKRQARGLLVAWQRGLIFISNHPEPRPPRAGFLISSHFQSLPTWQDATHNTFMQLCAAIIKIKQIQLAVVQVEPGHTWPSTGPAALRHAQQFFPTLPILLLSPRVGGLPIMLFVT